MFKIGGFEDELYHSMEKQLVSQQVEDRHGFNKLAKAADYLNSAAEIFENAGMTKEATEVLKVLETLSADLMTDKV